VNVQGQNSTTGSGSPDNQNINLTQTVGAVAAYSPEYKQLGSNEALLKDIAGLTGGKVLSDPAQAFRNDLRSTTHQQELWPWLMLLAILLFPLDIAIRRVRLSFKDFFKGFRGNSPDQLALAGAGSGPGGSGGSSPGSPVNRLFEAKQRVNNRHNFGSPGAEQGPPGPAKPPGPDTKTLDYYQPGPADQAEAGWGNSGAKGPARSFFNRGKARRPEANSSLPKVKPASNHPAKAPGGNSAEDAYSSLLGKFNRSESQVENPIPAEKNKSRAALAKPVQAPPPPPMRLSETPDNVTDRLLKAKQRARNKGQ
jgi:hypothetical protein